MPRKKRNRTPDLFGMRCEECSKYLVQSESGAYLVCPDGHGRLQLDTEAQSEADDRFFTDSMGGFYR